MIGFQAPASLDLAPCDLSPAEGEQRDLMATLKNDTPESERLNPEAPEFVPFGIPVPAAAEVVDAAAKVIPGKFDGILEIIT